MSNATTKRMIAAYQQQAEPTLFLSGFFQSPLENFHNSEEVEIDIMRGEEDVSIVIQDLSTGYRMNSSDLYTNKSFKPPIHKEAVPINAFDLIKREFGANPFENVNFQANAMVRAFREFRKVEKKIRRAVELQSSQVLQTGVVTLTDSAGASLYSLDYQAKATHFPSAGVTWGAGGDDPIGDLLLLGNVIRSDGLTNPDTLVFGETAFELFMADTKVQARLDNRRMEVGQIAPETRGEGAIFQGYIWIGNYRYAMWTYSGRFKNPNGGASTSYIDTDKVVMLSSGARLDATFGAIPRIAPPDSRALPFIPDRMSNSAGGMDLWTNAWLSPDGEQLFVGAGARPLMIPTAIDSYGCLDINA